MDYNIDSLVGGERFLSDLDYTLHPFEKVIWSGKPDRKAYFLPLLGFVLIGLVFALGGFLIMTSNSSEGFFGVIFLAPGIGIAGIPIIYYIKKYPKTEYILTDQRLILKSELREDDLLLDLLDEVLPGRRTWIAKHDEIKEIIVKKGKFWDKILGTGSIYFITPVFPYLPKDYVYQTPAEGETPIRSTSLKKVYNAVTEKHEEIPQMILLHSTNHHPRMSALEEPYATAELLRKTIFGTKTNHVSCEYCHTHYEYDKIGKCPSCGAKRF